MANRLNLYNFFINDSNPQQAIAEVEALIASGIKGYVCFCEANLLSCAVKNSEVANILSNATLIYPDGKVMQLLAQARYKKNIARVTGPDFILNACDYGQQQGWRHFFYGGAEGVADALAEKLKSKYPNMIVAGTNCPPFRKLTDSEEIEVKKIIESSKADFLWVGLGGPKQEIWMSEHLNKIAVPVMLGVGAAFDFHSGNRPWAPKIVRTLGLEWLFRALSGGRKTFFRNIKCVFITVIMVIKAFIKYRIIK